jgi:hypothetical protein
LRHAPAGDFDISPKQAHIDFGSSVDADGCSEGVDKHLEVQHRQPARPGIEAVHAVRQI